MNKKKIIIGFNNISCTDGNKFNSDVMESVENAQNNGLEVEIKYSTDYVGNGVICYSALVIRYCEKEIKQW